MKREKIIFRLLMVWSFIQVALWITSISKRDGSVFVYAYDYKADPADKFYPFDGGIVNYDLTELFVYAGIPILIYIILRLRKR